MMLLAGFKICYTCPGCGGSYSHQIFGAPTLVENIYEQYVERNLIRCWHCGKASIEVESISGKAELKLKDEKSCKFKLTWLCDGCSELWTEQCDLSMEEFYDKDLIIKLRSETKCSNPYCTGKAYLRSCVPISASLWAQSS